MIAREIQFNIDELAKGFPVVAVTGPRQSGKTTFIRSSFSEYSYFNLESPDTLQLIESDAGGFIRANSDNIIIDEIQRAPSLMSYLQVVSDEKNVMGNFIISGSENLLLSEKISQSLSGRAAYAVLYPLSISELMLAKRLSHSLEEQIFTGFYPAVYDRNANPSIYYDQYIATYTERDLRQIGNVSDLSGFRKFLGLLAGRIGQPINYESLGNDAGISARTIERWLSILEASYLIFRLQPYYRNYGKRLTKTPKIYFTDTGLACRLLGINAPEQLKQHYLRGGLFENMCIMEVKKYLANHPTFAELYFFRDHHGNEVDLIIEQGDGLIPIEIKSGASFSKAYTKGLDYFKRIADANQAKNSPAIKNSYIVYAGPTMAASSNLVNWRDLREITGVL
jgi:predicted AAA+ superfamily ATPase